MLYSLLDTSQASPFIRAILREKASTRLLARAKRGQQGDRRFFGEAFVASRIPHENGWYGSFKWLTSSAFVDGTVRAERFSRAYGVALKQDFGDHLSSVAERARLLWESHGVKAMPPDLWLIFGEKHRFIESKLRGDTVSSPQVAGLAVIAVCLADVAPVSVEVIRAFGESEKRRPEREAAEERQLKAKFREYCDRLRVR